MGKAATLFVQAYNVSQVIGWSWILAQVLLSLAKGEYAVFEAVQCPLYTFQILMLLDVNYRKVVNPLLGIAHGSAGAAFPQIASRIWHACFIQVLIPKYFLV